MIPNYTIWQKLMKIVQIFIENSDGRAELICQKSYQKFVPDKYFIVVDGEKSIFDLEYFYPNPHFPKHIEKNRAELILFGFINNTLLSGNNPQFLEALKQFLFEINPDSKNSILLGHLEYFISKLK